MALGTWDLARERDPIVHADDGESAVALVLGALR
jgi:hypothetical protein